MPETQLALYLSAQQMPTQMVFQLSHGQKLNSLNLNILLLNTNTRMLKRRKDALIKLKDSSRHKKPMEELLELLLLNQFHLLEIKLQLQISSKDLDHLLKTKEFHLLLTKLKLAWVQQVKTGDINGGTLQKTKLQISSLSVENQVLVDSTQPLPKDSTTLPLSLKT